MVFVHGDVIDNEYRGIIYSGFSNFAFYSVDFLNGYLLCCMTLPTLIRSLGGEDNKIHAFRYDENQKELVFISSQQIHISIFFADSVDFCVLGDVNCVRWNPFEKSNQRTFLTCSDDRTIRLWKYIE